VDNNFLQYTLLTQEERRREEERAASILAAENERKKEEAKHRKERRAAAKVAEIERKKEKEAKAKRHHEEAEEVVGLTDCYYLCEILLKWTIFFAITHCLHRRRDALKKKDITNLSYLHWIQSKQGIPGENSLFKLSMIMGLLILTRSRFLTILPPSIYLAVLL
jgi:hypothetical protein